MKVTPCECAAPGWCSRHRCEKPEYFWHLCRRRHDFFEAWEQGRGPRQTTAPPGALREPCRHRGQEPIDQVPCDLCGGRTIQVAVYTCALFGECTERRYGTRTERARSMASCLSCASFSPDASELTTSTLPPAVIE